MANALTRFLNPETGGLGLQRLEEARKSGLSDEQIKSLLPGSGATALPERAAAALGVQTFNKTLGVGTPPAPAQPAATPQPTAPAQPKPQPQPPTGNRLTAFLNPETRGLGQAGLDRARAAGLTDAEIRQLLPGSGVQGVGYKAANSLGLSDTSESLTGSQIYERAFQASLSDYKKELDQKVGAIQARSTQLESDLSTARFEQGRIVAEREEARARADAYEKEKKTEQELAVNEQLRNIRSGSTVSGSPGSGLGSLTAGSSTNRGRSIGKSERGSVLDNYIRSIDPTDSVLDERGPVVDAIGDPGRRAEAQAAVRRRGLASGTAGYYARRFG